MCLVCNHEEPPEGGFRVRSDGSYMQPFTVEERARVPACPMAMKCLAKCPTCATCKSGQPNRLAEEPSK